MKFTIIGSAIVAGMIAHYGFWDGNEWFRSDLGWNGHLTLFVALCFLAVGFHVD